MLDTIMVRVLAGALLALAAAGIAITGRSVLGPRGRVVARRRPARGSEGVWLVATGLAQAWILGVLVLPGWFYGWPGAAGVPGSTALQVLGLVLWFAGMGLAGWATWILGRFMTVSIQVAEGQRLVQDRPYAWVRHPIYTGNVAAALGLALLFLNPLLLGLVLLLALLASYRGRLEDAFLRTPDAFGERYEAYAARTGRFLPRLRRSGP